VAEVHIPVAGSSVSASVHGGGKTALVLGPGAGGNRRTGLLVRCAEALAASGRTAVLYNFLYTERGKRVPDPPATLEATAAGAAAYARDVLGAERVVLGGKSMGGRIASQAVAGGTAADALVFLGYPLHPPGRPEQLRDRHLPAVAAPMLFLQGTRDAFARWDLIEEVTRRLGDRARLERIEDADHSFAVPKRSGRTAGQVEEDLFGRVVAWLESLGL
jgi:predicted alpha/beta-hydrolase family hydrolase